MSNQSVVYIAGKYTDESHDQVFENIYLARRFAKMYWRKGYAVICPHTSTSFMDGITGKYCPFIEGDLTILSRLSKEKGDFIAVLPNYETSKGTKGEIKFAKDKGLEVLYPSLEELIMFEKNWENGRKNV